MTTFQLNVDGRTCDTILAALRFYQGKFDHNRLYRAAKGSLGLDEHDVMICNIADNEHNNPLEKSEIDELCQQINTARPTPKPLSIDALANIVGVAKRVAPFLDSLAEMTDPSLHDELNRERRALEDACAALSGMELPTIKLWTDALVTREGVQATIHFSKEQAEAEVRSWIEEWWRREVGTGPIPDDFQQAAAEYFEASEHEQVSIEAHTITAPSHALIALAVLEGSEVGDRVARTRAACQLLRAARDLLKQSPKARGKVQHALRSAEGAVRNAECHRHPIPAETSAQVVGD